MQNGSDNPNFRHGLSNTKEYDAWRNIKRRCTNSKRPDFKYYGGRGITICDRWRSFAAFYADMGDCPPGCSVDRIDNDLGYSPENCRWADARTQSRNRRIPHTSINVGSAHGMAKINDDIARHIYRSRGPNRQIAAQYDVSESLVRQIKNRKIWIHATNEMTHGG